MAVLAHPTHWLAQAIYLAPLVLLVLVLVATQVRDRRDRRRAAAVTATQDDGYEAGRGPLPGSIDS